MGLLGDIFSTGNRIKRNIRGLLSDPSGTVDQLSDQLDNYNKEVVPVIQGGLLQNRPMSEKEKYTKAMEVASLAPFGLTVWHGSPHKFTKFDMSKIGTGEGAQAYGHGLYMAETPQTARYYQEALTRNQPNEYSVSGKRWPNVANGGDASEIRRDMGAYLQAIAIGRDNEARQLVPFIENKISLLRDKHSEGFARQDVDLLDNFWKSQVKDIAPEKITQSTGALYKVDIPDEAVARFLDWDKKLSEQPHVADALGVKLNDTLDGMLNATWGDMLGSKAYQTVGGGLNAANRLKKAGVHGIRYLDGGSRSAGSGSSNFVLFDDSMPRILEVNGVTTGLAPWKQGEYQGLLK